MNRQTDHARQQTWRVISGEAANRIHVVPEGEHQELGPASRLATKQDGAAVAGDGREGGGHRVPRMPLVVLGVLHGGVNSL